MEPEVAFCLGVIFTLVCLTVGFLIARWINTKQIRKFLRDNKDKES